MKPLVCDLVDARRVRVAGVMPDAEGEIAKREAVLFADEAKDHAELAVRSWQVDLEADRKPRAVGVFRVAAAQGFDLNPDSFVIAPRVAKRLGARTAASHRVLGEGTLVKEDAGITPPDGQGLPLAVCGQKRPVLGL